MDGNVKTCECGHSATMRGDNEGCRAYGCGCDRNAEEAGWR